MPRILSGSNLFPFTLFGVLKGVLDMISSFCPGSRTGVENLCSLESDEELNCCGGEAINGTFGGLTNAS